MSARTWHRHGRAVIPGERTIGFAAAGPPHITDTPPPRPPRIAHVGSGQQVRGTTYDFLLTHREPWYTHDRPWAGPHR